MGVFGVLGLEFLLCRVYVEMLFAKNVLIGVVGGILTLFSQI